MKMGLYEIENLLNEISRKCTLVVQRTE